MSLKFDLTLTLFLDSKKERCLLLGDAKHGKTSLDLLKASVERLSLDLGEYKVLIFVEGARNGAAYPGDQDAFTFFEKNGAEISGCEDDISLSTESRLIALEDRKRELSDEGEYLSPEEIQIYKELLATRIVHANKSWELQIAKAMLFHKVILCCGTSHLPAFADGRFVHRGLINTLRGVICGFAVEKSNDIDGWYQPEKFDYPTSFAKVRAIG